ncbi:MAG TPA: Re/Si-specific NAD(P)(+) transhydrogenase subunit alpha [Polyangiaceae bacterium]
MIVAIPREIHTGERRVAATPDSTKRLTRLGFEVWLESGAGSSAAFPDSDYQAAGGIIVNDVRRLWAGADVVLKVRPPERDPKSGQDEVDLLPEGKTLLCFVWPAKNRELIERLATRKATLLAMDQIPRITRAQKMDALSSMANIAGYRAVIEAASFFGRFFTGQVTAAGKVPPAKVMVIGAGVAGLAAIGAARGLGAIVRAFDTRPSVKEQVQSMGAEFLDLPFEEDGAGQGGYAKVMSQAFIDAEMALFHRQAEEVDIIITTALVPGKPAPLLLPTNIVESMKPGSVIVDLAAEEGGNCELTHPSEVVTHHGVTIIGYVDMPSRLAPTASQLYGTNLVHLLSDMGGNNGWHINHDDEVVRAALILERGELMWPPPKIEPAPIVSKIGQLAARSPAVPVRSKRRDTTVWAVLTFVTLCGVVAWIAPREFLGHFTVFVLAVFVGYQVVWKVTPALHTPLMSVTNAISGIILVGGMLKVSTGTEGTVTWMAALAILLAAINISGGFLVTQRMLRMFQR